MFISVFWNTSFSTNLPCHLYIISSDLRSFSCWSAFIPDCSTYRRLLISDYFSPPYPVFFLKMFLFISTCPFLRHWFCILVYVWKLKWDYRIILFLIPRNILIDVCGKGILTFIWNIVCSSRTVFFYFPQVMYWLFHVSVSLLTTGSIVHTKNT